ncbi:MAG: R3H domain protein [Verrucomicrobia bacterium ADurb.Bin345]|nr:MAG: R3H domain protein [Verrucomicrobia bacterium ADurb.Bin345]
MSESAETGRSVESPQAVLENVLRLMDFEAKVERFDQEDGEILLHVSTPDAGRLIGRNAQVLEALQTVVNRMLRRGEGDHARYLVDIERYRERRKDKLLAMAIEAAEEAEQTGQPVKLPSMGARDRRTIHQALVDRPGVRTESEESGEEGEKRVVVFPK